MKDTDTTANLYRIVSRIRLADGQITTIAGQRISWDTAMALIDRPDRHDSVLSERVVTEDEYQQTIQAGGGAA